MIYSNGTATAGLPTREQAEQYIIQYAEQLAKAKWWQNKSRLKLNILFMVEVLKDPNLK